MRSVSRGTYQRTPADKPQRDPFRRAWGKAGSRGHSIAHSDAKTRDVQDYALFGNLERDWDDTSDWEQFQNEYIVDRYDVARDEKPLYFSSLPYDVGGIYAASDLEARDWLGTLIPVEAYTSLAELALQVQAAGLSWDDLSPSAQAEFEKEEAVVHDEAPWEASEKAKEREGRRLGSDTPDTPDIPDVNWGSFGFPDPEGLLPSAYGYSEPDFEEWERQTGRSQDELRQAYDEFRNIAQRDWRHL